MKPDTGLVRVRWGLDRDGFEWPRYKKPRKRDNPPGGGPRVAPGKYVVHVYYKDAHDSAAFKVLPDPRDIESAAVIAAREEKLQEYMRYARAGNEAFFRLRDARANMGKIAPLLGNLEGEMRDSLKKEGKVVRDSIKALMEIYLQPEGFTGIEGVTSRLGDKLWQVRNYLESAAGAPGGNSLVALELFKGEVKAAVARINRFLREDWAEYRKKVEAANAPLFKELEPVEVGD
jgi:hypothetical protein